MRCTSSTVSSPLIRRMNSMFHGHHGASAPHSVHVALDGESGRGVVPREREVDDPRRERRLDRPVEGRSYRPRRPPLRRQRSAPDRRPGSAGSGCRRSRRRRRRPRCSSTQAARAWTRRRSSRSRVMSPNSTRRNRSPAWRYVTAGWSSVCSSTAMIASSGDPLATGTAVPVGPGEGLDSLRGAFEPFVLAAHRGGGGGLGPRHEPHRVAGSELAELPSLGRGHDGRAHETAQAGAVGSEDDRHVPGEVDRADGVAGVVDVRRVEAGVAAVAGGPTAAGARSAGRRSGRS